MPQQNQVANFRIKGREAARYVINEHSDTRQRSVKITVPPRSVVEEQCLQGVERGNPGCMIKFESCSILTTGAACDLFSNGISENTEMLLRLAVFPAAMGTTASRSPNTNNKSSCKRRLLEDIV